MRSINIIIVLFLSLFQLTALSQFKVKTEYDYLNLINNQQNHALIKDNLKNTDMVVNRLVTSENEPYSAYFLNELVTSYNVIGQKELAFYYMLVQRSLFPNDSLSTYQKNNFLELAFSINIGKNSTKTYWDRTLSKNIPQVYTDRIKLLLELSTELHIKKLTKHIYKIGLILRSKDAQVPAWYKHWEFLTIIGVNEKQKQQIIHPAKYSYKPIFTQIDKKYRKKMYRKAIKHYTKTNAKIYAKELIAEYQAQDLSIAEKFDLIIKKAKIIL